MVQFLKGSLNLTRKNLIIEDIMSYNKLVVDAIAVTRAVKHEL